MKQMLRKLMSTLLALTMVLSLVPVSALADEQPDVKYGKITDGAWTGESGATGVITDGLPSGVSKVSKQAEKTADNTYRVTLTVEMTETTTTTPAGAVATVLVMDTSGSMGWCAKCGEICTCSTAPQWVEATTIDTEKTYYILGGNGRYREVEYCDGTHGSINQWNCEGGAGWYTSGSGRDHTADAKITPKTAETSDGTPFYERQPVTVPTRLDGAKAAAIDFLKSYSGFSADSFETSGNVKSAATNSVSGRYVALVEFADLAETKQHWVDVATVSGYQAVFAQINGFVAGGSTNLDAGLRVADVLLKDTTVSSIAAKNVIALTDGEPTRYLKPHTPSLLHWFSDITIGDVAYCAYGDGGYCDSDTFQATISTASTVKTSAKLYTICFGAGTDTMNDPVANTTITLANYLSQKIATPAADGKTYAYTAGNAQELSFAFTAISGTITSGLSSGTVTDSLPTGGAVTATGFAANWSLTKENAATVTKNGNTTTYTWTKSYTVTLDPTQTGGQDYYPLNGQTQLVVDGDTINFPIPAGRVTYPTVTGAQKELVTADPDVTGITYENYDNSKIEDNKIKADVGATVKLLYKITVTGGAGASFTVTDENTALVYPATGVTATNGVYSGTVGPNGTTEFYVSKSFANVADKQSLGNTITVSTPGVNPQNPTSPTVDAKKYTVTYNANGGTWTAPAVSSYVSGANVTVTTLVPTKTGFTFNGWAVTTDNAQVTAPTISDGAFTMPSANVTLTAQWTATVTGAQKELVTADPDVTGITYENYDNSKIEDNKIKADVGATVKLLYKITVTGGADASFTVTDENTALVYPATGVTATNGVYSGTVGPNGTTEFYVSKSFANVADKQSLGNTITVSTPGVNPQNPTSPTVDAKKYTVTYNANGGIWTAPAVSSYVSGANVTVTTLVPTKTGFTFNGWTVTTDNAEVTAPTISNGAFTMPSANVTLTAQWTATVTGAQKELVTSAPAGLTIPTGTTITYPVSNKISADVGDKVTLLYKITVTGGAGASFTVTEDSDSTQLVGSGATQSGRAYSGTVGPNGTTEFYVAKTFTIAGTANEKLGNSITVPGVTPGNPDDVEVEIEKYYVTYSYTGTVPTGAPPAPNSNDQYAKGAEVTVETAPTLAGYVFSGWAADGVTIQNGKFTMPGKDVRLTGSWSTGESEYKIQYFKEQEDGTYPATPDETDSKNGTTGEQATVTLTDAVKTKYTGYIYDENAANVTSAEIKGDGTTVLKLYYAIDKKGGGEDGKSPDGTPDKYQVFVYYASDDTARGTVAPTFEKIDLKDAQGNYVESKSDVTARGSVATATTDNAFDHWTKKVGTGSEATVPLQAATGAIALGTVSGNTDIYFTAYFGEDKIGGKDGETPGGSDGTPDIYQAVVTYKVVNGTWSDGSKEDKEAIFTLKTRSETTGEWVAATPTPTLGNSIPTGMIAINEQYTDKTAGWDAVAPRSDTPVTGAATYTYRFIKIGSAVFDPDNAPFDNGEDGVSYQPIFWKQLTGILPGPETFQITLTEVPFESDDSSGGNIEIRPGEDNKFEIGEPAGEPAQYTGTVTMSEAGRVAFDCETMTFDQPGDYIFIVKETDSGKSYIGYDDAEYELHISVGYSVGPASAQDEQKPEETVQLVVVGWFIQGGDLDGEGQLEATFTNVSSYTPYVPPYVPVTPQPTVKVKGLDTVNHVAYIVGRDNGLVDPNGTITRAEVATIYFRLMTEEFRDQYWSDACSFTDVADTAWYNVAIATLEKAGVIKDSVTGGSFRPNDPITRAELAVMAAQFCTVTGTIPKTSFTDIPSTYWAAKEIALVEYAGWIEGYNGKFRPDDNLTRAECVTIVNRMLNRGAEHEDMLDGMVTFPDNPVVNKQWYYEAIQEAANSHNYTRTGKQLTGEHFTGEKWTALLTAPDWAAMEQAWAKANQK